MCVYSGIPKIPKIRSLHIFTISPEKHRRWIFFCLQTKTKVFYEVVVSFWMCVTRLAQSTQNNTLQYLWKQEEWSWFFACRKTSNISSNWYYHFRCVWPGMPKLPKITSFIFLWNILKKKWLMKLIFYMQIKMEISYKLILWFLMGMVKHSQRSQNSKFAMSLQYLEKEVRMKLIFGLQKNSKYFFKLILSF